MTRLKVAVLGANGQLGQSLKNWLRQVNNSQIDWFFFSSAEVNITIESDIDKLLSDKNSFDYIVNCAAYTAVDQAEEETKKAKEVNATAVKYLAQSCKKSGTILIHISTDFVFDGIVSRPLNELDLPNPIGVYGQTKYEGEQHIAEETEAYFILRTGWLYSVYNKNFFKSMQRLFQEKEELRVVCDQVGTPTHTSILCEVINTMISTQSRAYGLYHVAHEGVASWYDFAYEILQHSNSTCTLTPLLTKDFPTPAKRPSYSVLDKTKVKTQFDLRLPHWKEGLQKCF